MVVRPVNLRETVDTVVKSMEMKTGVNGARILPIWSPTVPETLFTDSHRLQQILFNLLGNAVKFSKPNGTVEIKISDDFEGGVKFVVKDYGKGIERSQLNLIFEPFTQASSEIQIDYGGTGLGLSITKKLVSALGGTIQADSVLGEWTEFVFQLPQGNISIEEVSDSVCEEATGSTHSTPPTTCATAVPAHEQITPDKKRTASFAGHEVHEQASPFKKARVLVADDNLINQKLLNRVLSRLGVGHVDVASDGQEAVDMESQNEYDVILMDWQMPRMNGLEATRRIVNRERLSSCFAPKVVMVTANATDQCRQEAAEAGTIDFISKPFTLNKIGAAFEKLF